MEQNPPHVLIFPFPVQGHVNSMLKLAELLCLAGIQVTFLNSDHNHHRLLLHTDVEARFALYPGFRFRRISDGLPADHPRSGERVNDLLCSMKTNMKSYFKEMMVSGCLSSTSASGAPVTCIITDGVMEFAIDVAEMLQIPIFYFRTISACCFWAYFRMPEMIEAGDLPIKGNEAMDSLVTIVPGMETFLRGRDLPSFLRADDLSDPVLQLLMHETRQTPRTHALILNTFEALESPILSQIRTQCPKIYTIGPLHAHLKTRLPKHSKSPKSSNSLWEEDRSCISWLDQQPPKSVIYVSFGSLTVLTKTQLLEFWHGLVNSKQRFLWVIRPDMVAKKHGDGEIPAELVEGTKKRGYMVGWAPQEEVLTHGSVGGFLTHSGWNSTVESIVAGVPMLCWPYFADQQVNSRFVSEVWKVGFDMKDVCDREVVKKMVNDLMVEKREGIVKSTEDMSKLANESVSEGGSSYCNLDRLIEEIKILSGAGEAVHVVNQTINFYSRV